MTEAIHEFLSSGSRHKLIVSSSELDGLSYTDIGQSLSLKIKSESTASKISLIAQTELEKIMTDSNHVHKDIVSYIALKNLGILLEPDLKIDITAFLSRYSATNPLFIQWKGAIKQEKLHFLTEENGITINLENISHIIA
jgi:hypothetical protein